MRERFFPRKPAQDLAAQMPPLMTLARQTAFQILQGPHGLRKAGGGESFWQFREYQSGDSLQTLDWRQSGKTDRLFVRQKEQQKAQSFTLWCKNTEDMDFTSDPARLTKGQTASVLALALALLHTNAGEMVGYSDILRAGHSEKTIAQIEDALLKPHARESLPPLALATLPRHAGLYCLSDFLETPEEILERLTPLSPKTHNICLIQILDPAEITLPYTGRIVFESPSGRNETLTQNAKAVQIAYQNKIMNHIQNIKNLCQASGWKHILCRTDEPLTRPLLELYRVI